MLREDIYLRTTPVVFILIVFGLLGAAYVVFRRIVRRDYLNRGQLTWLTSSLQLLVFAGVMGFPGLYNPPEWAYFWVLEGPAAPARQALGLVVILAGFLAAFGTMAWFGIRRAFGVAVQGLVRAGPYTISRNPQIIGGYLLVIGSALQWPSWYAALWIILYGLVCHWMVLTEEEHLRAVLGGEYERYCESTPRYLFGARGPRAPRHG